MQLLKMRLTFNTGPLIALLLAGTQVISAQEYVVPLENNPQIKDYPQPAKKNAGAVMLELPVIDNFSYNSPFPDTEIWADNYAFINNGFAVNPPTLGVATLDAINQYGSVYPEATISPLTFDADFLTSHPVNLAFPASDSIYLSFFYQPMGNGLMPGSSDSLYLDFFDPVTDEWITIWGLPGDTLREFRQVMIPVTDDRFLVEGFRFGFRNRASLPKNPDYIDKRGNVDHWNIDYVRLDRNRSHRDTIIRDVAFNKPVPSMLKNLESIPWDHFEVAYNTIYIPSITFNYFNNDSAIRNVTRSMVTHDEVWNELYNPANPTAQDILPGTSVTHNLPNIYPFNFSRGDTASYLVKAWLRTDEFDNKSNDTIYRRQIFKDYFAYDDGTAERGYGIRGSGTSNGLIAVRFNSYIADELGGVDVYFTQLMDSLNLGYYFKFMVWDDVDGLPGNLIYEDDVDHTVVYSDILNKFTRFEFKESVGISGTFYVGLMQYNQYLLNIGLDVNKPSIGNLLYNIDGNWTQSLAPGSPMLRPFVKRYYSSVPREDAREETESKTLKFWPNPVRQYLHVELPVDFLDQDFRLQIFDITGKTVVSRIASGREIFVGDLPDGIYLLSVTSGSHNFRTERIIIQR